MFGHTFYSWPTFYCAGHQLFTACPLLEFHSTFGFTAWHSPFHKSPKLFLYLGIVQLALNHPSVHLHAENGEDQLQLLREYYGDPLQAEEGENRVQFNPERQVSHLHAEVGEDQVQLLAECYGDHLEAEEGEDLVERLTEYSGDPLQAEVGEDQVQLPPECYGDHRHVEEVEDPSPTLPRTQWRPPSGEDQVQLVTECCGDHLQAEQGEDQVQLIAGHHDGHLHAEDDKGRPCWEEVEAQALRNFACSF